MLKDIPKVKLLWFKLGHNNAPDSGKITHCLKQKKNQKKVQIPGIGDQMKFDKKTFVNSSHSSASMGLHLRS